MGGGFTKSSRWTKPSSMAEGSPNRALSFDLPLIVYFLIFPEIGPENQVVVGENLLVDEALASEDEIDGEGNAEARAGSPLPTFVDEEFNNDDDSGEEEEDVVDPDAQLAPDADPSVWNALRRDPGPLEACPNVTRARQKLQIREGTFAPGYRTPLATFSAFFTATMLEALVKATNVSDLVRAAPVRAGEVLIWLALSIVMGIKKLPSTYHYWATRPFGE